MRFSLMNSKLTLAEHAGWMSFNAHSAAIRAKAGGIGIAGGDVESLLVRSLTAFPKRPYTPHAVTWVAASLRD
jgi:hypothetical protein